MLDGYADMPPRLLQAAADVSGRIALILGAGCSLEQPTGLKLSSAYSLEIHSELIADNVLVDGECTDPSDLSVLASTVYEKVGAQREVVTRLPRGNFRDAQANEGYLIAAALLLEGAVAAVLTLNYDLAISDALGVVSAGETVSVIAHPKSVSELGARVVVYLHRNANEPDEEEWVLRAEVLDNLWKGEWEEVIAQRVLTSPVVVFAGLGSPAAVLTESVKWIRESLDDGSHEAYVIDPSNDTPFKAALDLPEGSHVKLGWCDFMRCLAHRLTIAQTSALAGVSRSLCDDNGWSAEAAFVDHLCEMFFVRGLVAAGSQRATWLLNERRYLSDGEHVRGLIAYLLLGLGLAQRRCGVTLNLRSDGLVDMRRDGQVVGSCLPVSAEGTRHWAAMEPRIRQVLGRLSLHEQPTAVLLGSLQGTLPSDVSPPVDIAYDAPADDIVAAGVEPAYISVDALRVDESLADRMVA